MPNRVIKDSINESFGLSECTIFAEDLYKRLITYADDYGRFNSDTTIMRARLYPREYEYITEEDIINGLAELAGVGKIEFYTATHFNQGKHSKGIYGVFPNWSMHQRIRDSKAKCPDPNDTDINDWYLRRFVSLDMKAEIIERDGFKCKICGKFLTSCRDSKRFAKLGNGLYHIDHIVPLLQGGRATLENLRLTCPECNLKRKKRFTFQELLEDDSRHLAASCGKSRPESNPIQSESNPYPNPVVMGTQPQRFSKPEIEEIAAYCRERGSKVDAQRFYDYYEANGWKVGKNPMKDWKAAVRTWERNEGGRSSAAEKPKKETSFDLEEYTSMVKAYRPKYKKKEEQA